MAFLQLAILARKKHGFFTGSYPRTKKYKLHLNLKSFDKA